MIREITSNYSLYYCCIIREGRIPIGLPYPYRNALELKRSVLVGEQIFRGRTTNNRQMVTMISEGGAKQSNLSKVKPPERLFHRSTVSHEPLD